MIHMGTIGIKKLGQYSYSMYYSITTRASISNNNQWGDTLLAKSRYDVAPMEIRGIETRSPRLDDFPNYTVPLMYKKGGYLI